MTKEAGDDDLGYVRSMGTAAARTHQSEEETLRGFLNVFRRKWSIEYRERGEDEEVDRERLKS